MNPFILYGWIGVAVWLAIMAWRAVRLALGRVPTFMPVPDEGDLEWLTPTSLALVLLAASIVAWPAVLLILLRLLKGLKR